MLTGAPHKLYNGKNLRLSSELHLLPPACLCTWTTSAGQPQFCVWIVTCPVQSELHDSILICIHANQSELLYNDQSELHDLDQLGLPEFGICIKSDQLGTWVGGNFITKRRLPFCSVKRAFGFYGRLGLLVRELFQLHKVSPFLH